MSAMISQQDIMIPLYVTISGTFASAINIVTAGYTVIIGIVGGNVHGREFKFKFQV